MTLDDFRKSLTEAKPPAELTLALAGLWWDAKGLDAGPRIRSARRRARGFVGARLPASQGRRSGQRSLLVSVGQASPICREPLDAEWLGITRDLLLRKDGCAS